MHITIALLGLLAYTLVTATLCTLAARIRQQRHRHDLILTARLKRKQYFDALAEKRGEVPEATANVDVV